MRLWSINPKYLDSIGLVAIWRESLLAKKVLMGKTIGYKNHPQLIRFKEFNNSIKMIDAFLYQIFLEAEKRGYCFNKKKCKPFKLKKIIVVTNDQLYYEFEHLQKKLKKRCYKKFLENKIMLEKENKIIANELFKTKKGKIANWEITKK
ncbi:MAG: pyrimidine dimer DNA glycosylase/endonuclease V [Candidatus ainarchaeum sp.]|nr:pyrimidine dimer DNA glycosylase/endonuclease V [Candidatus ainarchaeum sp.]